VTEPYVPAAPSKDLRTLPNIVFTPHCGSDTFEANARMGSSAAAQAASFLSVNKTGLCIVPL
jgi:phosphoglycerate dehydrogenase-like enzyme